MAKTFEVKTMNGFCVTAKMAGMESSANTRSVVSTMINTSARVVSSVRRLMRTRNFSPCISSATGKIFRARRMTGFFSGSTPSSSVNSILTPVKTRNAPKR